MLPHWMRLHKYSSALVCQAVNSSHRWQPLTRRGLQYIELVGTQTKKVTKIAGLEPFVNVEVRNPCCLCGCVSEQSLLTGHSLSLQELVLRSHLIKKMEGVETMTKLESLELYDNEVKKIENIAALTALT